LLSYNEGFLLIRQLADQTLMGAQSYNNSTSTMFLFYFSIKLISEIMGLHPFVIELSLGKFVTNLTKFTKKNKHYF